MSTKTLDNLRKFKNISVPVFSSTVRRPGRSRLEQKEWWQNYYKPRENERTIFLDEFMRNNETTLCRITGQMGTGKTSFLLDKLENPDTGFCKGFWVDMAQYGPQLASAEKECLDKCLEETESEKVNRISRAMSKEIDAIIEKEVKRRFQLHFEWLASGLSPDYINIDIYHDLNVEFHQKEDTVFSPADIWRRIDAAVLTVRREKKFALLLEEVCENIKPANKYDLICKMAEKFKREKSLHKQFDKIEETFLKHKRA